MLLSTLSLLPFVAPALADDPLLTAEVVLNDFHDAAARADGERYFAHFTEDAVFLGTDAEERWDVAAFRVFAEPYFGTGQGWTYVASERHLSLGPGKKVVWFDERLQNESYGEVRGSGVLRRVGKQWKIAQYNLAIPVPNDLSKSLIGEATALQTLGEPRGELHTVELGKARFELWEKVVPELLEKPASERPVVVLLPDLHFRARAIWDFSVSDYSVMDALARRGFDVFAVDPPGCGFAEPLDARSETKAIEDNAEIVAAIDRIRELRGVEAVSLVGPGWGAQFAGYYSAQAARHVRGVVLYDFDWAGHLLRARLRGAFGEAAKRSVTRESVLSRFAPETYEAGIPESFFAQTIKDGKGIPPVDWEDPNVALPMIDPDLVKVPCLLLHGDRPLDEGLPEAAKLIREHRDELQRFHAKLDGPRLRMEIPDSGPWPHLGNSHRLFQLCLAGWLERLPD